MDFANPLKNNDTNSCRIRACVLDMTKFAEYKCATYKHTNVHTYTHTHTCLLLLILMLWHSQAIFESKGDKMFSPVECRIRSWAVWNSNSPADWVPTHKPTALSGTKQQLELDSPFLWWTCIQPTRFRVPVGYPQQTPTPKYTFEYIKLESIDIKAPILLVGVELYRRSPKTPLLLTCLAVWMEDQFTIAANKKWWIRWLHIQKLYWRGVRK